MNIHTFELILLIYCSYVDIGSARIKSFSQRPQPFVNRSNRLYRTDYGGLLVAQHWYLLFVVGSSLDLVG